jgi:hypothetical protein
MLQLVGTMSASVNLARYVSVRQIMSPAMCFNCVDRNTESFRNACVGHASLSIGQDALLMQTRHDGNSSPCLGGFSHSIHHSKKQYNQQTDNG